MVSGRSHRLDQGRNLARDPRCTLSLATHDFDLVVEGEAHKVTDPLTVAAMAAGWNAEGWPARVDDTGLALTVEYSAASAGPPPWIVPPRATPRHLEPHDREDDALQAGRTHQALDERLRGSLLAAAFPAIGALLT
jgi:hypothetical protein